MAAGQTRAAGGARRCILYLQPVAGENPLWDGVCAFLARSRALGANEAAMYHPHCSVVGFFGVGGGGADSGGAVCGGTDSVDAVIGAVNELFPTHGAVRVDKKRGVEVAGAQVQIVIDTRGFRELAAGLRDALAPAGIVLRPKPLDHMSLAYVSPRCIAPDAGDAARAFSPDAFAALARETLDVHADSGAWELVLLEQTHQSASFARAHKFRRIAAWPVPQPQSDRDACTT